MTEMKKLKVVVIGGGSSYTPELVKGLLARHHELPVSQLWLVDIDAGMEKAKVIADLTRRMVAKTGCNIEVFLTTDRKQALVDADFVCSQFRAGRIECCITGKTAVVKCLSSWLPVMTV